MIHLLIRLQCFIVDEFAFFQVLCISPLKLALEINTKLRNGGFVSPCSGEECFGISSTFGTPFTILYNMGLLVCYRLTLVVAYLG